ncbi:TIR domain-containing protein [Saccharothrix sp. S26]|uniref:TIR domain-containing protein n=1 Tax=Saccharothrix sp. S26 TaxID=2907215 RepID=UPI001F19A7A3|nr:TIR domain-containing protein [Saccharothrix sp. S26]MCE6997883.1 TIR domain-containing protein [Saccharothrix sp. S26]
MVEVPAGELAEVAVVSCDISGHSAANGVSQLRRVAAINRIVADAIERREPGQVVWASGGDGGHVVFFGEDWQEHAVRLMAELCSWARGERVKLRVTGHVGEVDSLTGADGRTQVVGSGINFAGWLVSQATGDGIVVSDTFRRAIASAPIASEVDLHDQRLRVERSYEELLCLLSLEGVRSEWGKPEHDYASLKLALKTGNGWDALYYAKRISQINPRDHNVTAALERASRMLKSSTGANRSFLELLRADELTEMLKLGHLVERRPGEVICRVGEPGESMFVILRGEVGVYNLEGKGFGGTAEANNVHRAGEVVGELATALKRNRTADLVAKTDVALLSFISEEVTDKLSDTEPGKEARRQYDLFILDRVLQHTVQATPYLFGPLSIPPAHGIARVSDDVKAWEAAVRELLPHTELVTVAPGGFTLEIGEVVRAMNKDDPEHGMFVLVSGSVQSSSPVVAKLNGTRRPLLWVDVPKLFDAPPSTYERAAEPIMVLRIGAKGVDRLSLEQRAELRRSLESVVGEVPPEYEYDVYLCHSSRDKAVVREIKDRLWQDYGLRSWYDDAELRPGDSTRKVIEKGLMSSRFLLLCASANLNSSDWANREIDSVLHLDVKREHDDPKVLVLKLYENESNDEAIPRIFRGTKRLHFQRDGDFQRLAEFILAAGKADDGRRGP